MNRVEAIVVIKELFAQCRLLEGRSIKLLPPRANHALSDTFQIHIQTQDDFGLVSCVSAVASNHKLAVGQRDGLLVVYKPYQDITDLL
jgi:hypothetical protein